MKKSIYLFMIAAFGITATFSSCKEDPIVEEPIVVVASPIKTISVVYDDGVDLYSFNYNASSKKIDSIQNFWNDELDKTIVYDYSVAGKLTIISGTDETEYELNANGYATKEIWSSDEWAAFEYNADGYLVKIKEHWGDADHLKMEAVVTNGNIMKHTTYDDDGVTMKKIKEFVYTTGDNVNEIHQASMIDNNTKPIGNLFGKPSKKLVDKLNYWDPRESPIVVKTTTITYMFDAKNRPTAITRTGADWQEVFNYTYVE